MVPDAHDDCSPPAFDVAVFAHNEQERIESCLASLIANLPSPACLIHVLANGCSDGTERVVREFAREHESVRLHSIAMGDKSNAWNEYVHEIATPDRHQVFIDGDVRAHPGAPQSLIRTLDEHPECRAATGVPYSGRHASAWIEQLRSEGGLAGNLYALSRRFVATIRERGIRIPIGIIGEDALVGAMAAFDLEPDGGWHADRVAVVQDAKFEYEQLRYWNLADIRLYYRRRIRYAMRAIQNRMVRIHVKRHGFLALPRRADELYRLYPDQIIVQGSLLERFFSGKAVARIRAISA